jgi:hypothetical protein
LVVYPPCTLLLRISQFVTALWDRTGDPGLQLHVGPLVEDDFPAASVALPLIPDTKAC